MKINTFIYNKGKADKIITIILSLILLFLCFEILCAQADLNSFINKAYNNREEIQISKERKELNNLRLLSAIRALGPSISAEITRSDGKTITDPWQFESYGLRMEQSIFEGGRKYYTLKRELKALDSSKSILEKVENDIKFDIQQAYFKVLLNKEKVENYKNLLINTASEFKLAEKKYQAEIITEIDYMDIQNLRQSILLQKDIVQSEFELSKQKLKDECRLESIERIDGGIDRDVSEVQVKLKELKQIALRNRPEIKSLKSVASHAKYDEKVIEAGKWPSLRVEGYLGESGEDYVDEEGLPLASEWSVYAKLSWLFWGNTIGLSYGRSKTTPSEILDVSHKTESDDRTAKISILDNMDYFIRKKGKNVSYKQALNDLEERKRKVLYEVEEYFEKLKNSINTVKLAQRQLNLAEKRAKIIEKRKMLNEASSIDLIKARNSVTEQRNSYLSALYEYVVNRARLNKACGKEVFEIDQK
ncbi:MAG: TolC family protein [Elusimicrobiota bacterium]